MLIVCLAPLALGIGATQAVDGDTVHVTTYNARQAFESITQGDNPSGDCYSHTMPGAFDGAGA